MRFFYLIILICSGNAYSQENRSLSVSVFEKRLPIADATVLYKTFENDSLKPVVCQTNYLGSSRIEVAKTETEININYGYSVSVINLIKNCDSLKFDIKRQRVIYFKNGKQLSRRKI